MDRGEFLSSLRESLEGNVPMDEVEKNIALYRNYFEESDKSDAEVMKELGEPRLIARTIIDAYKASKGSMAGYYTEQARSEYSREHSGNYSGSVNQELHESGSLKWYEKAFNWIIIFIVLAVVLILVAKIVGWFVVYVLPVLLLIVLIKIIADHFKS